MTLKSTDKSYTIEVIKNQVIYGETVTVEEKANGNFTLKNGKSYIRYKTRDNKSEISTTVIIDGESVTIKRFGEISSVMEFRRNSVTRFIYRMPYGAMDMEIYTRAVDAAFDACGGTLKLRYTLTVQGEKYENNTTIRVTEG